MPGLQDVLVETLAQIEADLCLMTGDYRFATHGDYVPAVEQLAPVIASTSAPDGVVGVLGNHDFVEMVPGLERAGMRVLLNESLSISRNGARLIIAGVDDTHYYETDDLAAALAGVGLGAGASGVAWAGAPPAVTD